MQKREKILAIATGLAAVGFFTYLAINRVFLLPAAQRFNQATQLLTRIQNAKEDLAKEGSYRTRLKELAGRTFGSDELRVSELVRSRITAVLKASGLRTESLTLKPVVGSRVPGIYKEIGWMVRVRGSEDNVVNFLYLMSEEPHLHRLDSLVVNPIKGARDVELQVKYGTLVLEPVKGETLATGTLPENVALASLEAPDRRQYEVIAKRDLFRPYIPAPKAPPVEPTPGPSQPTPPQPPEVPTGRYRVVGLPTWGGRTEILIRDSASGNVATYHPGDDLAGGKVVLVDYRPMPLPNRPHVLSESRVVLRIGYQYYAVELGTSLEEKYPLQPPQVPAGLPRLEPPPAEEPPPSAEEPPASAEESPPEGTSP